ncbi:hypothetical protein ACGFU4_35840 [Streptomyces sp. NPDC048511]|uniref:hypothetical protein n=1 Tax=Streptomyces sp. NPDC048511 TaxID=3365562 RepID=UPI003718D99B
MFYKHGDIIALLLLLIASAIPYWLLINAVRLPFWLTIVAAMLSGLFSALVAAPMARVILTRMEDRARVRRDFPRSGKDAS